MARRAATYLDYNAVYDADYTSANTTGTTDVNTGFIILPPWVADKLELAGCDLTNFFFGEDVKSVFTTKPDHAFTGCNSDHDSYHMGNISVKSIGNVPTNKIGVQGEDPDAILQKARDVILSKVRRYLSEEDLADIGMFHYLLSGALHKLNPMSALCHEYEYAILKPIRNAHMCHTVGDGNYWKFGQATLVNKNDDCYIKNAVAAGVYGHPLADHEFQYDTITGSAYTGRCGLGFYFSPSKGVTLDSLLRYSYTRIKAICDNIPERVIRTGEVAKVYSDKGSIVIVPRMTTVLNVADMLSHFDDVDTEQKEVDNANSSKERLLALIEQVVAERRCWVGTHGVARDGLAMLYTRQL